MPDLESNKKTLLFPVMILFTLASCLTVAGIWYRERLLIHQERYHVTMHDHFVESIRALQLEINAEKYNKLTLMLKLAELQKEEATTQETLAEIRSARWFYSEDL